MTKYIVAAGVAILMMGGAEAGSDPNMRRSTGMEAGSSAGKSSANQSDRNYNQKGGGTSYNPPSNSGGGKRYIRP